jgi:hypothetical protein
MLRLIWRYHDDVYLQGNDRFSKKKYRQDWQQKHKFAVAAPHDVFFLYSSIELLGETIDFRANKCGLKFRGS